MLFHAAKRQKESSQEYTKRIWRVHILTKLGKSLTDTGRSLTVQQVTVTDCMALHDKMRSTPYMANRVLEVLHSAFVLAMRMKWVQDNSAKVDAYPEHQRRRKPSPGWLRGFPSSKWASSSDTRKRRPPGATHGCSRARRPRRQKRLPSK